MARLKETYETSIRPQLMKEFGYANPYQVPQLQKIVVNVGMGEAIDNPKLLDTTVGELAAITGQRPAVTRARKSISNFRLREDMAIGAKVTLRGDRMYEFMDRLINVAIPRIRDFRGVPTRSFDGRGNYTIGIKEQLIFPEVDYDKVDKVHGMDITIVTTAERDDEAFALLSAFGMPFRRQAARPVATNV
ncbi:MAG: 50S ribosomal protein L5 [Gemmatimonadota bacterium]